MGNQTKTYVNAQLRIEVGENEHTLSLRLLGKSLLRDPNQFILPIFRETIAEAERLKKRLVIDFTDLLYMNSSTLTPVIKILESVRVGQGELTVLYRKSLKWQDISFSALTLFQTADQRIEIKGAVRE